MPTIMNYNQLRSARLRPAIDKEKLKEFFLIIKIITVLVVFGYFITLAVITDSTMLKPLLASSFIILLLIARLKIYK